MGAPKITEKENLSGCLDFERFSQELQLLEQPPWTVFADYAQTMKVINEKEIILSICYSVPFKVPYLFIENLSGDEIHEIIGYRSEGFLDVIVSRDDHPITGTTGWACHPCRTAEMMTHLNPPSYLLCWLSIYGAPFGLTPSLHAIAQTFNKKIQ